MAGTAPGRARRPTSPSCLSRVMSPLVQDRQRVDQLAPKEIRAPAVEGQRRQRRHARTHAAEAPEVRLEAPHRDQHSRRRRRTPCRRGAPASGSRARSSGPASACPGQTPPEVRLQVEREFGLLAIALERSRLRLHVAERAVERGLRDPALERFLPHVFDEGREGRRVDGRCRCRGRRGTGGSRRWLGLPRAGGPCGQADQRQNERDTAKHVMTVARTLLAAGSRAAGGRQ